MAIGNLDLACASARENLALVRPQGMAIGNLDLARASARMFFRLSEAAGDGNRRFTFSAC